MVKGFLFAVGFIALYGIVGTVESTDVKIGKVDSISGTEIVVEDGHGNLYAFEGTGYKEGQKVRLTFFNGGDTDPTNDILVKAVVID